MTSPAVRSTEGFINESPIDIRFTRHERERTSAGGFVDGAPTVLPPQRVRLVSQRSYVVEGRMDASGDVAAPRFVVVGMPDLDIRRNDTFRHNDEIFRITRVSASPDYAKRGEAIEHGTAE